MKEVYNESIFDFVLFQAKLSPTSRSIDIIPEQIYNMASNVINPNDSSFRGTLKEWSKGMAITFDSNGKAKKEYIQ